MTVVATDLVVGFGDRTVLDHVSLTLAPGLFTCIVGPNGAGKTTLLRCVAGDLRQDAGLVTVDGVAVHSMGIEELATTRTFLSQAEREDIPYTVSEVVGFGTHMSTLAPGEHDRRVTAAMDAVELTAVSHRVVATLSGGERRRVAIARTLARTTAVLLLDEPTDSLDLGHADTVMTLLAQEATSGRTVAATSHDLNLASRHGDHVVVLDHGRIVAQGSPSDVLTAELLSEVYACSVRVIDHPEDGRPVIFV